MLPNAVDFLAFGKYFTQGLWSRGGPATFAIVTMEVILSLDIPSLDPLLDFRMTPRAEPSTK